MEALPPPPPGRHYETVGGRLAPERAPTAWIPAERQPPIVWKGNMWDRQPREGGAMWNAFRIYRDMGDDRSLADLKEHPGTRLRPSTLDGYCSKWKWNERVRAYDEMMDQRRIRKAKRELDKMTERHINSGVALQDIGEQWLEALRERVAAGGGMEYLLRELSPTSARAFLVDGIEIERRARGADKDQDEVAREVNVSVKVDVFTRIDQMARNYRALQEMTANRPVIAASLVEEPEADEEDEQAVG